MVSAMAWALAIKSAGEGFSNFRRMLAALTLTRLPESSSTWADVSASDRIRPAMNLPASSNNACMGGIVPWVPRRPSGPGWPGPAPMIQGFARWPGSFDMFFDAIAVPLALLAVALPFLFAVTDSPIANFWPLIASWVCGAVLLLLAAGWARAGVAQRRGPAGWGWLLAGGLGLAALVASVLGLVQYLAGDVGLGPWIHASVPGQAVGNLRQRNQQATLLSLGAWAWLWWTLHARPQGNADLAGVASPGRVPSTGVWGVLTAVALMWIAVGGAATASRTVVVQWLLVLVLLVVWRGAGRGEALRLGIAGFAVFLVAAWVLPEALWKFQGVRADALFHRFTDGSHTSTSGLGLGRTGLRTLHHAVPGRALLCAAGQRAQPASAPGRRAGPARCRGVVRGRRGRVPVGPALERNRARAPTGLGRAGDHRTAQHAGIPAVVRAVPGGGLALGGDPGLAPARRSIGWARVACGGCSAGGRRGDPGCLRPCRLGLPPREPALQAGGAAGCRVP